MRFLAWLDLVLLYQRGHLLPWAPVCLGLGIALYFLWPGEPGLSVYASFGGMAIAVAGMALRRPGGLASLGWAVALLALGFLVAGARAHRVGDHVLGWRYYGPVEGRIVATDRSASDALRLTLDQVRLTRVPQGRTPGRVRVSLHGAAAEDADRLHPGMVVMLTAHLSPPQGPVEPGGFDFRRHAWFQGLGAVGYSRVPVMLAAPSGAGLAVARWRARIGDRVRAVLPGAAGGFAVAVITGDRSGIQRADLEALRAANTAHLLAISGLHMGLLVGVVFAVLRYGLALFPWLALRLSTRKLAAAGALAAAAIYLIMSGRNVATERAFVMAAVVLLAVLLDRRAISLRAVAVAAMVVLLLRPETLLGPGFQMSFAATTALVAVFGAVRRFDLPRLPRWVAPVVGVLASSAIAGAATAPVGAFHFNAVSQYGLVANLLSVPLMGSVVMPAAVLAAALSPVGLEAIGLWVMGWGLRWILFVAQWVAGWDGARIPVVSPEPWVLPVLALGGLVIVLWQGRARLAGLIPVAVALWIWAHTERPEVLIADTGTLVGAMGEDGRVLSKPRGAGFVARNWLENDGDGAKQAQAHARGGDAAIWRVRWSGGEVVHLTGKRAAQGFGECARNQVIVAPVPLTLTGSCRVLDPQTLRLTGAVALGPSGERTARATTGARLWSPHRGDRSRHAAHQ